MKKIFVLLFLSLLFLQSLIQTFVITNFYVHRDAIANEFCVNKSKPQLHCNGSCHLRNQISKTTTSNEKTIPFLNTEIEIFVCNKIDEFVFEERIFEKEIAYCNFYLPAYQDPTYQISSPPPQV